MKKAVLCSTALFLVTILNLFYFSEFIRGIIEIFKKCLTESCLFEKDCIALLCEKPSTSIDLYHVRQQFKTQKKCLGAERVLEDVF